MKSSTLTLAVAIISLFFVFSTTTSHAQERFRAGAMLGFNLSQLDGDNFSGYDKKGISGGLRVATVFNDRLDFMVEMLYTQTGSQFKNNGRPVDFSSKVKPVHIRLNYVEVPLLINYHFKQVEKRLFRYEFFAGVSVGRLIGTKITEDKSISGRMPTYADLEEDFNKNHLGVVFGLKYNFNNNFGMALRHTLAGTRLYKNEEAESSQIYQMRSYFLSFHTIYMFDINN